MNRSTISRWLCSLLFLVAVQARADSGWLLTTADFTQAPVTVESIDASGFHCTPVGAAPQVIPLDNFLQLDRSGASIASLDKFTLILLGGDRLQGAPTGYQNEQVVWQSGALGSLQVPLKSARALVRSGKPVDGVDRARTDDQILMGNGDSVKGIVTDISDQKVTINANGSDVNVPLASVDAILFAQAGKPETAPEPLYRLKLTDGSVVTARSLKSDAAQATIVLLDNSQRKLPLAAVAGIELLNGPVSWLSSRTPEAVVQTPYFGSTAWPTRMDQTVGGKPITLGGRTYARGIGVHAYSRIEYALDGSYEAMRTQYAIAADGRNQYADVTVRIKVDAKTVHEVPHFRADSPSPLVVVDIPKSAKLLTLEVDYGDANDTQDRFNWIEPALLKHKPAPPPPPPAPVRPATLPTTAPAAAR